MGADRRRQEHTVFNLAEAEADREAGWEAELSQTRTLHSRRTGIHVSPRSHSGSTGNFLVGGVRSEWLLGNCIECAAGPGRQLSLGESSGSCCTAPQPHTCALAVLRSWQGDAGQELAWGSRLPDRLVAGQPLPSLDREMDWRGLWSPHF